MAVLTLRDGTRLQVPDNATPDQVKRIMAASTAEKHAASAAEGRDAAWADTPWYTKAAVGFAKPFVETGVGIKSMFTDIDQDDRNALDAAQGIKGAAGTVGSLAGDVAMFATPGGVGGQVLRKGVTAGAKRKAARLGIDAASAAAIEGTRAHGRGEDVADAAVGGVTGTLAGAGVGRVLGKTLSGVTRKAGADDLLTSGVKLTPGQAAKGGPVPWLEARMAALPIAAGRTKQLQQRAITDWNREVLQSTAPAGYTVKSAGQAGFKELQDEFGKLYGNLWNTRIPLQYNPAHAWADLLTEATENLSDKQGMKLVRKLTELDDVLRSAHRLAAKNKPNGKVLEQLDDQLRDLVNKAKRDGDSVALGVYQKARKQFRNALPATAQAQLKHLDAQYALYKTAERAGSYKAALQAGGVFNPSQLLAAVRARSNSRALATGNGLLQDTAQQADEFFGELVPSSNKLSRDLNTVGAGGAALLLDPTVTGTAAAAGFALPREYMRRVMLGENPTQRAVAGALRRSSVSSGNVGAAVAGDDE